MQIHDHIKSTIKDIYFYTSHRKTFEPWDYMNPLIRGIGGSEISQIEMASRLANRHHNVVSYTNVPWEDEYRIHRNVMWKHSKNCTFKEDGIWIIYRDPEALDSFTVEHDNQEIWFVSQDVFYKELNEERAEKIDKFICLCSDHAHYVAYRHPTLKDKIVVSSNGIDLDLIKAVEDSVIKEKIVRNPHRLIYSSSPDRGLEQLIPIFKKAKEFVPDLELHIFYGFDNIDKIIESMPWVGRIKDSIMNGINSTDGIFWHGRVGQVELLTEWFKSGIWCYPVNFTETSCISCMEAQACGVIPIVSPVWALRENVMHGICVNGDITDKLTLARFVGEIINVCNNPNLRERLYHEGGDMIMDAKTRFNWERYADQWESWIFQPECKYFFGQYAFQQKYAFGEILNIGCDIDASDFKGLRNAWNLDVQQNPQNSVDIIVDIRAEGYFYKKFDTVIVGDLIEHMTYDDAIITLKNVQNALKDKESLLIITCPSDPRPRSIQNPPMKGDEIYPGGVSQFHRYIKFEELSAIVAESGLEVQLVQEMDCTHFKSYGLVCSRK